MRERSRGGCLPADAKSPKSPPFIHSAGTHQGAYATRDFHWACSDGSASPSSRRELLRYPATRRWLSFACALRIFIAPPSICPNKRAYPRASLSASPCRPHSFSLSLSLRHLRARSLSRLVLLSPVRPPFVNFAAATMPRGGRETRQQPPPLPPPSPQASPSSPSSPQLSLPWSSYVGGDKPCRRRAPSRLRGHTRASPSTRGVVRASRRRRPVVRDDSSAVRNVHTQIYLSALFSFLPSPREEKKHALFAFSCFPISGKPDVNAGRTGKMFAISLLMWHDLPCWIKDLGFSHFCKRWRLRAT